MNKRTPKIVLGTIIAIIVVGVSAKPMLIKHFLCKYDRASFEMSRLFDRSHQLDMDAMKAGVATQADAIAALKRLGYLSSFNIPIQSPRADAEDTLELLTAFCGSHKIPALVMFENHSTGVILNVIDKPDTRSYWDMFVRTYLEMKDEGQQAGPGLPPQGVGHPDP
mgnify:CR=1 FL=1